jgi:hypothetical protein
VNYKSIVSFFPGEVLIVSSRLGADRYHNVLTNVNTRKKQFGIMAMRQPHPMYKESGKRRYTYNT